MRSDNIYKVPTPCYVVEEKKLKHNLEILKYVADESGAKVLLAQKAFSMFRVYPLISKYLSGTTASGIYEARLGFEEMKGGEVHVFCPAYKEKDMDELVKICDHIIFNSVNQWNKFKNTIFANKVSAGIRVNPEYSEVETDLYDPCGEYSRLGIKEGEFFAALENGELEGIDGIHFHTMCEQGADTLERTLVAVEKRFGRFLKSNQCKWVNFGGGHHITRECYDLDLLISEIKRIRDKYSVEVYIEPGEAIALNAGVLITEVMDIRKEGNIFVSILDTSAACHMPDVLEMPYRPYITGSYVAFKKKYTYRFGGPTCLAGDVIGEYSFDEELKIGDRLEFHDMAIYSMVKNNTFNGMPLPAILLEKSDGEIELVRGFSYEDFKQRLI